VDAYLARDRKDTGAYHPVALRTYQFRGQQAAMPGDLNAMGLYFNRALFDEAGVPLPSKDHKHPRWTHDELLDLARRLTRTRADGTKQFGFAVDNWIGRWFPFLWGNGGDAFDNPNDPQKFTFVSRETETTLQWLADLRLKHQVAPAAPDLVVPTPNVTELFKAGHVAILADLVGSMSGIDRVAGLRWENGPLTRGPAGRFTRLAGAGYGVHPQAKNKETAWAFVKFFTGVGSPKFLAERATTLPPVKDAAAYPRLMDWITPEAKAVWFDTLDYGRVQPLHLKWQDVMEGDGARKLYSEALDGKRSVKDALELIKQHADAILK
jgi:ABC-type glycerol-3-phosphate transport system substrate-binding protein